MEIHVTTGTEQQSLPTRLIVDYLDALITIYAGIRFVADPDYAEVIIRTAERNSLFSEFRSVGPHGAVPFLVLASDLAQTGQYLLGAGDDWDLHGAWSTPVGVSGVHHLLSGAEGVEAFRLRSVRTGSIYTEVVLEDDLGAVAEAFRRLIGAISRFIARGRPEEVARAGPPEGLDDALSDIPGANASFRTRAGLVGAGLIAAGVDRCATTLRHAGARSIQVRGNTEVAGIEV